MGLIVSIICNAAANEIYSESVVDSDMVVLLFHEHATGATIYVNTMPVMGFRSNISHEKLHRSSRIIIGFAEDALAHVYT